MKVFFYKLSLFQTNRLIIVTVTDVLMVRGILWLSG
ncbi:uncharacterized protein METZ01_LOCUS49027 [marine metagenome]|uniref:Uncharacterized protein n=1 Tax=marine metagenome TaxID=408172 RepID=A0A381S4T8_9ZZZZ